MIWAYQRPFSSRVPPFVLVTCLDTNSGGHRWCRVGLQSLFSVSRYGYHICTSVLDRFVSRSYADRCKMIRLRTTSKLLFRSFSSMPKTSPKVAIVGSGPAGFYTAKYLLEKHPSLTVDILEALPTPFGLVRHGVAPDHPEVKSVVSTFTEVAQHARCRFFGNVSVGMEKKSNDDMSVHVSMEELRKAYDVIVLAYGASSDTSLNIPGEDLQGVMSARSFVNWYNGHPLYANHNIDLSRTKRVVIVGQGNVAIDCARILAKQPDELASTDIAPHALNALRQSAVSTTIAACRMYIQKVYKQDALLMIGP